MRDIIISITGSEPIKIPNKLKVEIAQKTNNNGNSYNDQKLLNALIANINSTIENLKINGL